MFQTLDIYLLRKYIFDNRNALLIFRYFSINSEHLSDFHINSNKLDYFWYLFIENQ